MIRLVTWVAVVSCICMCSVWARLPTIITAREPSNAIPDSNGSNDHSSDPIDDHQNLAYSFENSQLDAKIAKYEADLAALHYDVKKIDPDIVQETFMTTVS